MLDKLSSKLVHEAAARPDRHSKSNLSKQQTPSQLQAARSTSVSNKTQDDHNLYEYRQSSGSHKRKHESAFPREEPRLSASNRGRDPKMPEPRHSTSQKPASYTDILKSAQPSSQQSKASSDKKLPYAQAPNSKHPDTDLRESSICKTQHCSNVEDKVRKSAGGKDASLKADVDTQALRSKRQMIEPKVKSQASKGKVAPPKTMLSFGDEMEIEEPENGKFSLADTTHRKLAKERKVEEAMPAPEYTAALLSFKRIAASRQQDSSSKKKFLGQLCFGASSTRGERAYMEDRHTVVASYSPQPDGNSRSFAAVYDGHNGAKAAEQCSSRWAAPSCTPLVACGSG